MDVQLIDFALSAEAPRRQGAICGNDGSGTPNQRRAPTGRGDGAWSADKVEAFERWLDSGKAA
jgi:hypothetical protein